MKLTSRDIRKIIPAGSPASILIRRFKESFISCGMGVVLNSSSKCQLLTAFEEWYFEEYLNN